MYDTWLRCDRGVFYDLLVLRIIVFNASYVTITEHVRNMRGFLSSRIIESITDGTTFFSSCICAFCAQCPSVVSPIACRVCDPLACSHSCDEFHPSTSSSMPHPADIYAPHPISSHSKCATSALTIVEDCCPCSSHPHICPHSSCNSAWPTAFSARCVCTAHPRCKPSFSPSTTVGGSS